MHSWNDNQSKLLISKWQDSKYNPATDKHWLWLRRNHIKLIPRALRNWLRSSDCGNHNDSIVVHGLDAARDEWTVNVLNRAQFHTDSNVTVESGIEDPCSFNSYSFFLSLHYFSFFLFNFGNNKSIKIYRTKVENFLKNWSATKWWTPKNFFSLYC